MAEPDTEETLTNLDPAEPHADPEVEHHTEPDPLPPITAMDRLAIPAARSPSRPAGLRAAWIASVVLLAAAVVGAIVWRGPLVRIWPPASRILGQSIADTTASTTDAGHAAAVKAPAPPHLTPSQPTKD